MDNKWVFLVIAIAATALFGFGVYTAIITHPSNW